MIAPPTSKDHQFSNKNTNKISEDGIPVIIVSIEPREELVQVNELDYDELLPTANNSFRTTVSWQKPLFKHSEVKHYRYRVLVTDPSQRKRRGTALNTAMLTVSRAFICYILNSVFLFSSNCKMFYSQQCLLPSMYINGYAR